MGVSRRRRRVVVASVCLVALGVTGLVVRRIWLTDTARIVDAQEAVDRFHDRQSTTAAPTSSVASDGPARATPGTSAAGATGTGTTAPVTATLSVPGVYRYATTGSEQIDVLGGARHEYPAETLFTVTPEACGVRMRWDLLQERWEDLAVCATADGIELQQRSTNYHEFFQHGQEQILQCDRTVLIVPADGQPHAPVAPSCILAGAAWAPVWEVLERTTFTVEGRSVEATHVRQTVQDDDDYWEHLVTDYWFDDHGLPVRITSTKENRTNSGLVGDVVYHETFTADLESLTPLT